MSCYSCWPSTPLKGVQLEIRNEAFCAQGKTGRIGLQVVRYFQELILWAQFLYLLTSRKALKSCMTTTVPVDRKSSTRLEETFWENMCSIACIPLHQNHPYTNLPSWVFGAVSQSCLRCCLLGCSPHFAPNKT